jgi:hypothetical protein
MGRRVRREGTWSARSTGSTWSRTTAAGAPIPDPDPNLMTVAPRAPEERMGFGASVAPAHAAHGTTANTVSPWKSQPKRRPHAKGAGAKPLTYRASTKRETPRFEGLPKLMDPPWLDESLVGGDLDLGSALRDSSSAWPREKGGHATPAPAPPRGAEDGGSSRIARRRGERSR